MARKKSAKSKQRDHSIEAQRSELRLAVVWKHLKETPVVDAGDSKVVFSKRERRLLRESRKIYKLWVQDGDENSSQNLRRAFELTRKRYKRLEQEKTRVTSLAVVEPTTTEVSKSQANSVPLGLPEVPTFNPIEDHKTNSATLRAFLKKLIVSTSLTGNSSAVPHEYLIKMSHAVYEVLVAGEQNTEPWQLVLRPASGQAPVDNTTEDVDLIE